MSQDLFKHLQKPKGREPPPNPNPVKYLGTIWWVMRTKQLYYYYHFKCVLTFQMSRASLAATTTKVYFTVHLRLQDCHTWLGIPAATAGSREQRGFLWRSEGLMRAEGPFHNTVQGCCGYFGPREVCGGGDGKGEFSQLIQFLIKWGLLRGKSTSCDIIDYSEQESARVFY